MRRSFARLVAGAIGLTAIAAALTATPAAAFPLPKMNPGRQAADFDGDGRDDIARYRPSDGTWQVELSANGGQLNADFGEAGDVPLPADVTGDHKADFVLWRPSDSTFSVLRTDTGARFTQPLGTTGDIPVSGDYDGDGKADFTVFRVDAQLWITRLSTTGAVVQREFGGGDVPLAGDYDGDGKSDLAVWTSGGEQFHIQNSRDGSAWWTGAGLCSCSVAPPLDLNGDGRTDLGVLFPLSDRMRWEVEIVGSGDHVTQELPPGEIQLFPGDYDGDHKDDMAVWQQSGHLLDITRSSNELITQYGQNGDRPFALDFDGDAKADRAVWRPANQTWYILRSSDGGQTIQALGDKDDLPVPADYDGDGRADLATYRPATGLWLVLRSSDGQVDVRFWGGSPGDVPVPGDYDGDKRAERAVWTPSQARWGMKLTSTGEERYDVWGESGDTPVLGDVTGDGKQDKVLARQTGGTTTFHILPSDGSPAESRSVAAGGSAPTPQRLADFDGNLTADPVRVVNDTWNVLGRPGAPARVQTFAHPSDLHRDVPVAANYLGDRRAEYAFWRPFDGTWHVQRDPAQEKIRGVYGVDWDVIV